MVAYAAPWVCCPTITPPGIGHVPAQAIGGGFEPPTSPFWGALYQTEPPYGLEMVAGMGIGPTFPELMRLRNSPEFYPASMLRGPDSDRRP